jgi:hypothetical protein
MRPKATIEEPDHVEPTVGEEMAALRDDDLIEFMNLTARQTGIDGIIFLSTVLGQHGPRVKYFAKAGKDQPSFSVSIGPEPRILASSLPERAMNRVAPAVIEWVKLNREALQKFWHEGETWTLDEVNAFADRLKKLPRD